MKHQISILCALEIPPPKAYLKIIFLFRYKSHTLVINFGTVLSTEALVLKRFIIHIELLHHVVIELVPSSTGAAAEKREQNQRTKESKKEEKKETAD